MSVTQIRNKPEMSDLGFTEGPEASQSTFQVFQGLKGVCRALNGLEASGDENGNQFTLLSEAAAALVLILDSRQTAV